MSERVADGRWFRILTAIDQFTRECLCLLADRSLTGEKVTQALEPVVAQCGAPRTITMDNGSEFASRMMIRVRRNYNCFMVVAVRAIEGCAKQPECRRRI